MIRIGQRAAVIAAALLFGIAAKSFADDDHAATMSQTFVVQSMLDDRKAAIGTGVVVERTGDVLTLATAAHVIQTGGTLRILDMSRRAYYDVIDVRVIAPYDIALVRVRAQDAFPVTPVAIGAAQRGEAVWVWGNPDSSFWTLSTGTVQSARAALPGENGSDRIVITCETCSHGDSGAGVFTTGGKLIGIAVADWREQSGRVLFTEVQPLAPILAQY